MLTAAQIRKKFHNASENGYAPSLYAINQAASRLGYRPVKAGAKSGYNNALYTALWGHLDMLHSLDSEYRQLQNTSMTSKETGPEPGHVTYNGEPDRPDYDWELEESIDKAIKTLLP